MSMYKRIGILEHVGYGNLGDDATVAAVMENIITRWPQASIVAITLNPDDTEKRHGIRSYAIRRDSKLSPHLSGCQPKPTLEAKLKAILSNCRALALAIRVAKALAIRAPRAAFQELLFLIESFRIAKSLDLLVVSGGGQLRDSADGPYKFTSSLFKWVVLAKVTGAQCYFLNVGAGPLRSWTARSLLRWALPLASYISFRDEQSQSLIRRIGFRGVSDVHADCVYALPIPNRTIIPQSPMSGNLVVGLSPMRVHWDKRPSTYARIIRELGRLGVWLSDHNWHLRLFSTELWCDVEPIRDLHTTITNERSPCHISCAQIDGIPALLSQMSAMDYIVTCRFHGVVFAHLLNIPVLAISHHPKVSCLMKDIGLSDYCLDIDTFDLEQLSRTFTRLVNNVANVKAIMAERAAQYRSELNRQFDSLFLEPLASSPGCYDLSRQYCSKST